ncbi:MFS transporter [Novispirillum sp. DQ9]|uniref:MFS transporter n=1 Tax=Novispirillum sp. DQ9 TaxID=3398612 RepID=UPI003C7BBAB4
MPPLRLLPTRDGLRLSLLYGALFTVIGLQLPYWPVWLEGRGLGPEAIGLLVGAAFWGKLVTNPTIAHHVDRRGRRKDVMIALAIASTACFALFLSVDGFWGMLVLSVLGWSLFAGMMPLSETLTMSLTTQGRLDYGRVRLWGSLTFIATAMLGGWVLEWAPTTEVILWLVLAGMGLIIAATIAAPEATAPRHGTARLPFRALLRNRPYLLFIATASLTQVSHTVYYAFATLHWRDAGLSGGMIGGLWALGVIAEVVLFAFSGRVVALIGPERLVAVGAVAGVLRWTVLAVSTDPWLLAPAQVLHAATFGCTHLGAMHFIARRVEGGLTARAQAVYSSVAMGLAPGLGMLAAGPAYAAFGGLAFLGTALVAAAAMIFGAALIRSGRGEGVPR